MLPPPHPSASNQWLPLFPQEEETSQTALEFLSEWWWVQSRAGLCRKITRGPQSPWVTPMTASWNTSGHSLVLKYFTSSLLWCSLHFGGNDLDGLYKVEQSRILSILTGCVSAVTAIQCKRSFSDQSQAALIYRHALIIEKAVWGRILSI